MTVPRKSRVRPQPASFDPRLDGSASQVAIEETSARTAREKTKSETKAVSPDEISGTLDYKKGRSIRFLPILGVPWFALPDCLDALGYHHSVGHIVHGPDFPAHSRSVADEVPDPDIPGDPMEVVLLSPVGVWYLTHLTEPYRNQCLASWARKHAEEMRPDASRDDPAMFLTVQPDGLLPPYPSKFSGRRQQWTELRQANPSLNWSRFASALAA